MNINIETEIGNNGEDWAAPVIIKHLTQLISMLGNHQIGNRSFEVINLDEPKARG